MSKYESISLRNKIMISMDIDELILGGLSREEVLDLKTIAKQIFQAGGFKLPKLHCNCELEFEDANIKTLEESPKVITQWYNIRQTTAWNSTIGRGFNCHRDT